MALDVVTGFLDKIPTVIAGLRDFIIKIIMALGLPEQSTYMLVAGAGALLLSFFWFRRWTATSVFSRISTFLNFILLALTFYLVLVYV